MQIEVENLEGLQRKVTVTVSTDIVEGKFNQRVRKVAKEVRVNGFRPGKVPPKVVEKLYGVNIRQEILAELVDENLKLAIQEHQLEIVGEPRMDSVSEIKSGEPFVFSVQFETFPEIELKLPEGKSIEVYQTDINAEDVSSMIEKLRKENCEWILADRPAQNGDQVQVDFEGFIEDKLLEGGSAKDYSLLLGSNSMIPGFEEGLLAAQSGDETTLNLTFPAGYAPEVAGKDVVFNVKVNKVFMPSLITDDAKLSEKLDVQGGVEQLRPETKKTMERQVAAILNAQRKKKVLEILREMNDFVVPDALIDAEVTSMQKISLQMKGLDVSGYSELQRAPFLKEATERTTLGLLLKEAIKKFDLKADPKRVRIYVEDLANNYPNSQQVVDQYYQNSSMMAQLEWTVMEDMAVDKIVEVMKVDFKPASYEELIDETSISKDRLVPSLEVDHAEMSEPTSDPQETGAQHGSSFWSFDDSATDGNKGKNNE